MPPPVRRRERDARRSFTESRMLSAMASCAPMSGVSTPVRATVLLEHGRARTHAASMAKKGKGTHEGATTHMPHHTIHTTTSTCATSTCATSTRTTSRAHSSVSVPDTASDGVPEVAVLLSGRIEQRHLLLLLGVHRQAGMVKVRHSNGLHEEACMLLLVLSTCNESDVSYSIRTATTCTRPDQGTHHQS